MTPSLPFILLLSSLAILFPIGTYCLILARINRRPQPLVVRGVWDCAGLLLALSGILFFLWPSILTGFNYRFVDIWLYHRYGSAQGLGPQWRWVWPALLWLVYAVVVLGGCVLLLWKRRAVTCIYNVEPVVVEEIVPRVLDRLGLEWSRSGDRFAIGCRSMPQLGGWSAPLPAPHHARAAARAPLPGGSFRNGAAGDPDASAATETTRADSMVMATLLAINSWPAMRHVTLHWEAGSAFLRKRVEAELSRHLARVWTRENPAGRRLMLLNAIIFPLLFILTVLFQVLRLRGS